MEREKDNFKSREVKCLKDCALALRNPRGLVDDYVHIIRHFALKTELCYSCAVIASLVEFFCD